MAFTNIDSIIKWKMLLFLLFYFVLSFLFRLERYGGRWWKEAGVKVCGIFSICLRGLILALFHPALSWLVETKTGFFLQLPVGFSQWRTTAKYWREEGKWNRDIYSLVSFLRFQRANCLHLKITVPVKHLSTHNSEQTLYLCLIFAPSTCPFSSNKILKAWDTMFFLVFFYTMSKPL